MSGLAAYTSGNVRVPDNLGGRSIVLERFKENSTAQETLAVLNGCYRHGCREHPAEATMARCIWKVGSTQVLFIFFKYGGCFF